MNKSRKPLYFLLIVIMIAELAVASFVTPGWFKGDKDKKNGNDTEIEGDNYSVTIAEGSFEGMDVVVEKVSNKKMKELKDASRYELLGNPISVECDEYDGTFLGDDVKYTVPIPDDVDDLGRLVFIYFAEDGEERYLWPDEIDTDEGTMTIYLPHFSLFGPAELTEDEQIEAFLDKYSMNMAIDNAQNKQAASDLEPYVRAKIEAMGLTKEATEDLIQSTLNYAGGCFKGTEEEPNKYGDIIETGTKASTAMIRGVIDNDKDKIQNSMEELINGAVMHCWSDLKYTERIDEVLGGDVAGNVAEKTVGNVNNIAKMAGCLAESDYEGAAQALGDVMQSVCPPAELATKGARFLTSLGNMAFTNWKSNQIEELYQIYKNGASDIFKNEVFPGDRESFLMYLNTSSGFTMAKGVMRFYNMDKISETCEKYGWDFDTYAEMPTKYKNEFERRAENGLMEYFELRRSQEEAAEKIKAEERKNIQDMLEPHTGALVAGNYMSFFGESSPKDFDITSRLERLVNVRRFISQYVDEDALARYSGEEDSYTYGFLQNQWIMYASQYKKAEAVNKFCEYLENEGLLKHGAKNDPVINEQWYVGTWSREDAGSGNAVKIEAVDDKTVAVTQMAISSAKDGNKMEKCRAYYSAELTVDPAGEYILIGPGFDIDGNEEYSPIKFFKPDGDPNKINIVLAPKEIRGTDRGESNEVWYRRD